MGHPGQPRGLPRHTLSQQRALGSRLLLTATACGSAAVGGAGRLRALRNAPCDSACALPCVLSWPVALGSVGSIWGKATMMGATLRGGDRRNVGRRAQEAPGPLGGPPARESGSSPPARGQGLPAATGPSPAPRPWVRHPRPSSSSNMEGQLRPQWTGWLRSESKTHRNFVVTPESVQSPLPCLASGLCLSLLGVWVGPLGDRQGQAHQ